MTTNEYKVLKGFEEESGDFDLGLDDSSYDYGDGEEYVEKVISLKGKSIMGIKNKNGRVRAVDMDDDATDKLNSMYGGLISFFAEGSFTGEQVESFMEMYEAFKSHASFDQLGSFMGFCLRHGLTPDNILDYTRDRVINIIDEELSFLSSSNRNNAVVFTDNHFYSALKCSNIDEPMHIEEGEFLEALENVIARKFVTRAGITGFQNSDELYDNNFPTNKVDAMLGVPSKNKGLVKARFGVIPTVGVSEPVSQMMQVMWLLRFNGDKIFYEVVGNFRKGDMTTMRPDRSLTDKWDDSFAKFLTISANGYTRSWIEYKTGQSFDAIIEDIVSIKGITRPEVLTMLSDDDDYATLMDHYVGDSKDEYELLCSNDYYENYVRVSVLRQAGKVSLRSAITLLAGSTIRKGTFAKIIATHDLYYGDIFSHTFIAIKHGFGLEIAPILRVSSINSVGWMSSMVAMFVYAFGYDYISRISSTYSLRDRLAAITGSEESLLKWLDKSHKRLANNIAFRSYKRFSEKSKIKVFRAIIRMTAPPWILVGVKHMSDKEKVENIIAGHSLGDFSESEVELNAKYDTPW